MDAVQCSGKMPGMGKAGHVERFSRGRKGFYKWYRGRTRYVCPIDTPGNQISGIWQDVRKQIDAGELVILRTTSGGMTYRELLAGFLAAMESRVKTRKPRPLSARMLMNYDKDLNEFGLHVGGGLPIADIGPDQFAEYGRWLSSRKLKASGIDSKVAHVVTAFRWAVSMEYLDRVRFGSEFSRPAKREIRDDRISKTFSFQPADVARLIHHSARNMRPMITLAVAAAMNNSEIAWLERDCIDLATGIVDFRRRKTGKLRRVIPLPPAVIADLKGYLRPPPKLPAYADLFFLTTAGLPYVRMRSTSEANTLSVLFGRLCDECDISRDGRGFKGLRTTFTNLAPAGYREEVELITGHAHGTILLDSYLETVGMDRLRHVVDYVWSAISTELAKIDPASISASASSSAPASD